MYTDVSIIYIYIYVTVDIMIMHKFVPMYAHRCNWCERVLNFGALKSY